MLPESGLVLCAVSGGADSMCMLTWLRELAGKGGFTVAAAHFNHRLRGENADRDEAFVRSWCEKHKIEFRCGHGDVRAAAAEHGWTIEEAARNLRYAYLEKTAVELGAVRIATAHNAEDNAETVLMNLVRGTGMEGLTGIAPVRGIFIRPMLCTTRREIEEYLRARGVPHIEDETNRDLEITRNKIRLQVMPVLRQINPSATESINRTAGILREENRYLNQISSRMVKSADRENGGVTILRGELCSLPAPVAKRVLRRMLSLLPAGKKDVTAAHIDDMLALARNSGPSARLNLPGGIVVRNVYDRLRVSLGDGPDAKIVRTALSPVGRADCGAWRIETRVVDGDVGRRDGRLVLNNDAINDAVFVDRRGEGDRITLDGRSGKSLKKLMIDEKVPAPERDSLPVVFVGGRAAAVYGLGVDEDFAPRGGCRKLVIDFFRK
jgi:tRNA(Ile)-lysidine synthase